MKYFTKSALGSTQEVSIAERSNLHQLIVKIMRIGFIYTALLLITMQVLLALPVKSQKISSVRINLELKNESLLNALKKIEAQTPFRFVYRKGELTAIPSRTISASNYTVEEALNLLFVNTEFSFKQVDNNVLILQDNISQKSVSLSLAKELSNKADIVVRGQVTDSKGVSLPGVSVLVKGATTGASTDLDGKYTINVPDGGATLVFTYIGFDRKEVIVTNQTVLNVQLTETNTALSEVVVTALGVKRQAKSLGYATGTVDAEQITTNSTVNIGNSLQGKVSGVNVSAPSSGPGGSSKIRIRGQSSFGGDNSPLIIVNGVPINNVANGAGFGGGNPGGSSDGGDGLQSINPDDIESINILKGAAASALYGFRAKDGAVIITTKSGSKQKGVSVEFNSNTQMVSALDYTDFQYEYGQGEFGVRPATVADAQSSGVWSFGVKFDGVMTPQFDGSMKPYLPNPNRVKDFYEDALNLTNSIAFSGGDDKGNFRLSYSDTDADGIVPNSSFVKRTLNIGLNYNLTKKLSIQVNTNYSNERNDNPPQIGIEQYSPNTALYTMANSIDVDWLKNYTDASGNEMPLARFTGRNNPYWLVNKKFEHIKRDRLFGNASVNYKFNDWLSALVRVGQDYFSRPLEFNRPTGSRQLPAAPTGFNGQYYQASNTFRELNYDFLINANRTFGKFGVNMIVGGNQMNQINDGMSTFVTNFFVRDLYTIGNGQIRNPDQFYTQKKVNSFYGSAELSYNDYLFLNVTARNDWFSTLNPNSNSYLYPSVSSSFVFTEAMSSKPSWLNYGKIRAAYAEVGGDTNPYANSLYYSMNANTFNGVALGNISGGISPNASLRPLKVKEAEVGMEIRTLGGRVNLDFSLYRKNTVDEILNVNISDASGFGQTRVNVGRLRNEGVEMLLSLVPVEGRIFRWESAINGAYNKSEVLELAEGQARFDVGVGQYFGTISHEVGMPLGSVRSFDYRRDAQGRILTTGGKPLLGNMKTFGSAIPTWTGGFINTFTYKGIRLFTQADFKFGAVVLSNSNFNFVRHGLSKKSLEGREGGVLMAGFNADGSANTTRVEAEEFYATLRNLGEPFVYDASFIRMRTISLGYDLGKIIKKDFLKSSSVSLFVNNPFMIKKYLDNLDPESQIAVSDNFQGIDTHSLPTTRNIGLNLNVKF
jgi:TonB-linked SusC/RagA family outer membrane protein